ncbi:N-alpha-acetyltransferase 38, NatC auxiliary subunit [Chelonus insularis]|uniref:N-alpha-acetyltransferase 38, NatC auxiliary subunit n=1 Tax=Chelonus insularis TaxID=460826 RepID=UPI00158A96CD|nr:N-alpha-acetyltransferase 38, NatC auxiliary subunit [Chelonus insularis]
MKNSTNSPPVITENNDSIHGNGKILDQPDPHAREKLKSWLNHFLRIKMTDGRVLTGLFLCTDRDANVILGSCDEYLSEDHSEPRGLGLVMVPGRHIVSIHLDDWFRDEEIARKKRCSNSE